MYIFVHTRIRLHIFDMVLKLRRCLYFLIYESFNLGKTS